MLRNGGSRHFSKRFLEVSFTAAYSFWSFTKLIFLVVIMYGAFQTALKDYRSFFDVSKPDGALHCATCYRSASDSYASKEDAAPMFELGECFRRFPNNSWSTLPASGLKDVSTQMAPPLTPNMLLFQKALGVLHDPTLDTDGRHSLLDNTADTYMVLVFVFVLLFMLCFIASFAYCFMGQADPDGGGDDDSGIMLYNAFLNLFVWSALYFCGHSYFWTVKSVYQDPAVSNCWVNINDGSIFMAFNVLSGILAGMAACMAFMTYTGGNSSGGGGDACMGGFAVCFMGIFYCCVLGLFVLQCIMSVRVFDNTKQVFPLTAGILSLETILELPIVLCIVWAATAAIAARDNMAATLLPNGSPTPNDPRGGGYVVGTSTDRLSSYS